MLDLGLLSVLSENSAFSVNGNCSTGYRCMGTIATERTVQRLSNTGHLHVAACS